MQSSRVKPADWILSSRKNLAIKQIYYCIELIQNWVMQTAMQTEHYTDCEHLNFFKLWYHSGHSIKMCCSWYSLDPELKKRLLVHLGVYFTNNPSDLPLTIGVCAGPSAWTTQCCIPFSRMIMPLSWCVPGSLYFHIPIIFVDTPYFYNKS